MIFSSLTFIFGFLPAFLLAYYIIPSKHILARKYVLLLCSVLFYAAGEPIYVFVMLGGVLVTWFLTRYFENGKKAKLSFATAILINLLPFLLLKYFDFIADNVSGLLHTEYKAIGFLPLGISFYTFQILSYVIDVYHGKVKRQENLALLGLYIFLFPQLIAGPIVRYSEIEKDLIQNRGG